MQFELKPLSREAIPRALERVERYRLLNEPELAESICRDVLRADADNQAALVALLLALTDQFASGASTALADAEAIVPHLRGDYERAYYAGIIAERHARAQLGHGLPGAGAVAYEGLAEAMQLYQRAEALRPAGNDDAILRW